MNLRLLSSYFTSQSYDTRGKAEAGRQENYQTDRETASQTGMALFKCALGGLVRVVINGDHGLGRVRNEDIFSLFFGKDLSE